MVVVLDANPVAPTALHGESVGLQPNPRQLNIEQDVMNQIDRIGYLRSIGEPWQESVFHLRDLVVGLEDEEFWDGVPKKIRATVSPEQSAIYNERGWNSLSVRMKVEAQPDGTTRETLDPTPAELSLMLRIMMGLFARRGVTWRRTVVDRIHMEIGDD